jgi:hypothetical protein
VEPRAVQYAPPPLTRWQSAWRYLGAAVLSAVAWGVVLAHEWDDPQPLFWLDFALGPLSYVLLRWRRRWPLEIALAIIATNAISPLSAGPAVLALLSLSTTRRWRWIVPCAVLFVVGRRRVLLAHRARPGHRLGRQPGVHDHRHRRDRGHRDVRRGSS